MNIAGLIPTQVLNRIIQDNDYDFIKRNNLDVSYFAGFEEQFNFIEDHYKKFGKCPDMTTFLGRFNDFAVYEVNETDDYLVDRLQEERGYYIFREILPELENKIKDDSRLGYYYLIENLSKLKPKTRCKGIDIIANAKERYEAYINRCNLAETVTISTGFKELDDIIGGWEYGDELVTIVGRTGECKSFLQENFLMHAWKQGKRVGLYSGEMNNTKIGYRFDTLFGNFSNRSLIRGKNIDNYKEYIEKFKNEKAPFIVVTQKEFGGRPTVQQIRNFIEENNIEIMGIDQISLMEDSRAGKNDPVRIRYGHISEDLFSLSSECKIPILALAQANRDAKKKDPDSAPGLENIKESDDIAHNSSKCIGIRKINSRLILDIIKNRDGISGNRLIYECDIDKGYFSYVASPDDAVNSAVKQETINKNKEKFENNGEKCPF